MMDISVIIPEYGLPVVIENLCNYALRNQCFSPDSFVTHDQGLERSNVTLQCSNYRYGWSLLSACVHSPQYLAIGVFHLN